MHFVDATKPWKSQHGFNKERRCLQPSEGTQTPSGRRFGGESQETPPKNELSALKNVSLPYIHMENSDLRWEIFVCRAQVCGFDKRQGTNVQVCAWETFLCPDFGLISKGMGAAKQFPGWESHF